VARGRHVEATGELVETSFEAEFVTPCGVACNDAHEESVRPRVSELLAVIDVPSIAREQTGHRVNDADLIWAGERDDALNGLVVRHRILRLLGASI
jgi:hypothetical protein